MKWIVLFSATIAFAESLYQKHLPKNVYECVLQKELIDENSLKITREIKHGEIIDTVTLSIEKEQGQCVLLDYWSGQALDNFRGMQVAYQKGQIIVYVIFDGMGRDYLAYPPFSKEDETNITLNILDLIEGGYMKLVEKSKED